jgi:hypothetical protein
MVLGGFLLGQRGNRGRLRRVDEEGMEGGLVAARGSRGSSSSTSGGRAPGERHGTTVAMAAVGGDMTRAWCTVSGREADERDPGASSGGPS